MKKFFAGLALMSLAMACGQGFKKEASKKESNPQQQDTQDNVTAFTLQYMDLLNEHRIKLKLRPLTYNLIIQDVAKAHSQAMAQKIRPFGHLGFTQRCRQIKNRLGPYVLCGEMVAMGQKTPKETLKAWLNSPRHRQEIENSEYTHTGLGLYKDNEANLYWTQILIELN
jgi:uncharacterized protein YkwD